MDEQEEFQKIWSDIQQEFAAHTKTMQLTPVNGRLAAARFIFYAALLNDFGLRDTIPVFLEVALRTKVTCMEDPSGGTLH